MSGWEEFALASLGRFSSGKPVVPGAEGQYKAYGSNGVIGGSPEARHNRGIIVGRVGAYCGSVAVSHDPFWASDNTIVIEPIVEDDLKYLYYLLRSANLNRYAGGSAQPLVTQGTLKALLFAVPGPILRRRIGHLLGHFDDLIENNQRRVQVLEEMARAIYREWFVKFRYPGHEDVPLVDSALGPIPDGWIWGKVDDLVRIVKDTVDPSTLEPETPAVGLEHIPRKQVTLDDWGFAKDLGSRKAVFTKGDVLFGKIRPYFHKVSVAPIDGICSTDAIVIRPNEHHWGEVVLMVSSAEYVAHATQTSNGTKMPRADWKVIGQWPVAIPSVGLADAFTGMVRDQLDLAETLMFKNRRLSALRDSLLPKLVTGQIDVAAFDLVALLKEQVA